MKGLIGTIIAIAIIIGSAMASNAIKEGRVDDGHHDAHAEHWSWYTVLVPESAHHELQAAFGPSFKENDPHIHISHVFMGLVVLLLGIGLAFSAGRKLKEKDGFLPPRTWSALAFFDVLIDAVLGLMTQMMPRDKALKFLPLVASFAVFILIANFLALIPGFLPPTDSLRTTLALGLVAFVAYNWWGIKTHGFAAYFKHFLGPVWWLSWLILPIELISHFVRPASLALRLMGNMYGDHQVLGQFLAFGLLLIPLPVMALGLMVVVVQTLVFTLLTIVYIALAVEEHEHHDEEHGHAHGAAPAH